MEVHAVLFDIDGTLVDSNEQHVNAWAFAFREAGHPQEPGDIRRQIGKGGDLLVPALLPEAPKELQERIAERQGRHFKDMYLDHVRNFESARKILAKVHDTGRKVVLASSAKREELEHHIEQLGAAELLPAG